MHNRTPVRERRLYLFLDARHPELLATLAERRRIDEPLAAQLDAALEDFSTSAEPSRLPAAA